MQLISILLQPYGTVLGSPGFTITDPDASETHICTMTCDVPGKFQMDKSAPYLVRFIQVYSLDNNDTTPITCTVTVTDQGGKGIEKLTDSTTLTITISRYQMSLVMRKPAFCICENKDADQLRGNREADQRLCFRFTDSTIPLLPKSEISSL